jgi:hypothetical protein
MRVGVVPLLLALQVLALAADPDVDGKNYLLSTTELPKILSLARQRLAKIAPHASVSRVHVVSAIEVETYFRPSPRNDDVWQPSFVLQRSKGQWRIIREDTRVPVIIDH